MGSSKNPVRLLEASHFGNHSVLFKQILQSILIPCACVMTQT